MILGLLTFATAGWGAQTHSSFLPIWWVLAIVIGGIIFILNKGGLRASLKKLNPSASTDDDTQEEAPAWHLKDEDPDFPGYERYIPTPIARDDGSHKTAT